MRALPIWFQPMLRLPRFTVGQGARVHYETANIQYRLARKAKEPAATRGHFRQGSIQGSNLSVSQGNSEQLKPSRYAQETRGQRQSAGNALGWGRAVAGFKSSRSDSSLLTERV